MARLPSTGSPIQANPTDEEMSCLTKSSHILADKTFSSKFCCFELMLQLKKKKESSYFLSHPQPPHPIQKYIVGRLPEPLYCKSNYCTFLVESHFWLLYPAPVIPNRKDLQCLRSSLIRIRPGRTTRGGEKRMSERASEREKLLKGFCRLLTGCTLQLIAI